MATMVAGANTIIYSPPSQADIFVEVMEKYREKIANQKE
jgi:hypothetical protein